MDSHKSNEKTFGTEMDHIHGFRNRHEKGEMGINNRWLWMKLKTDSGLRGWRGRSNSIGYGHETHKEMLSLWKWMIPVVLDATNHDILQASGHEKWHKIGETGKLSVSYQHMRRVWRFELTCFQRSLIQILKFLQCKVFISDGLSRVYSWDMIKLGNKHYRREKGKRIREIDQGPCWCFPIHNHNSIHTEDGL